MKILGLRIGTTNTTAAVSTINEVGIQMITFDGEYMLPTVIAYHGDRWLVGRQAKALIWNPDAEVFTDFIRSGARPIDLHGVEFTPSQLASIILREVRRCAEIQIGEIIHSCVLSTPAYSTELEREIWIKAVSDELEVLDVVDEPICAIIGAKNLETAQSVLVVRMGGLSTDLALATRQSPWKIDKIYGDRNLGGANLDTLLFNWYLDRLPPNQQDYYRTNLFARRRLFAEVEQAKCRLSTNNSAVIGPTPIGEHKIYNPKEITREEFENLAKNIADSLGKMVERVVKNEDDFTGVSPDKIDSFMFYGGSASVPILRKRLEECIGHSAFVPSATANISARGAALIGASRFQESKEKTFENSSKQNIDIQLETPGEITIMLADGKQRTIFEQGTSLPVSSMLNLQTDNWIDNIRIPVYVGNSLIGDFVTRFPIVIGPKTSIRFKMQMDTNQHITCEISIPDAQITLEAELVRSGVSDKENVPTGELDRVHFTITTSPVMSPGRTYELDFWAHLDHQLYEIIQRVKEQAAGSEIKLRSIGPIKVSRGTILTVRLDIRDLIIDPQVVTILWDEEIGNAGFLVTVPEGTKFGTRSGIAGIYVAGLRIATLGFVVDIQEKHLERSQLAITEKRTRRAYASYSSKDNDAVLARLQGIQKAAPMIDVFWDRARLRSGENWLEALRKEILSRDTLYLFWSLAASKSKWVDWEWRFALENHGIQSIDPVPLVSPDVVPPPPELAFLHFNDWMLAYMNSKGLNK